MPRKTAPLTVLVLAAGRGKRMRSKRIKMLHPVAGRPMIAQVLETARGLAPSRLITIVGHQADQVRAACGDLSDAFVLQRQQLGTGHAVLQAASQIRKGGKAPLLILNGDVPTIRRSTLRKFVDRHRRSRASLSVFTTCVDDPAGYGRIVRDENGDVERIVEDRDATPQQRRIREINSGIFCADAALLLGTLRRLRPDNAQGEYYLTDAVHRLLRGGNRVQAVLHDEPFELLGVNDRLELAQASATLYARKAEQLQRNGVTLIDASRTLVDSRAKVGRDTLIYPDVIVEGASSIGSDCVLHAGTRIRDCRLGRRVEVLDHCVLVDSKVGDDVTLGPFAHLRPGARLGREVKVGNFVEVKKATLGRGTKASHLAYLGDAKIGEGCNIGAGTITCNYDGERKFLTTLGDRVFIGSDTQLVAPVRLGDGAYVGAGGTITKDVPSGALALSRVEQCNIEGWAARRKKRRKKKS